MAAIDKIISWANSALTTWQADAVRRLLIAGEEPLRPDDYAQVLLLAKAQLKLEELPSTLKPIPPAAGRFSGVPTDEVAVKLVSIEGVENVNRLKFGEVLNFTGQGVTVIYGENGSGKSGYSRILKSSCQARDKDDRILPDVFAKGATGKARATINITESGKLRPVMWEQGLEPDPILTNISVFDGRCARIITDESNSISYLPYGCDVFQKLGNLIKKVKTDLLSEISEVSKVENADVAANTTACGFLDNLSENTSFPAIEAATAWTEKDESELEKLLQSARASGASMVEEEIGKLERSKQRITGAASNADDLHARFAELSPVTIRDTILEFKAAKDAYALAVGERQNPEPLPGVASTDQWQILYEAAKKYSEEVAYPKDDFPKMSDALCVLCQQPILEDAAARFERFKKFIEDESSVILATKRDALISLREKVGNIKPLFGDEFEAFCDNLSVFNSVASDALRTFQAYIILWKKEATSSLDEKNFETGSVIRSWPASPGDALRIVATGLADKIDGIKKAAKPEEYQKILIQLDELKSRKALNRRKKDILSFIKAQKRNADLRHAADSLRTNEITKQGTGLIGELLTPELKEAFEKELNGLKVKLPVSIKSIGSIGETSHEMLLIGAKSNIALTEILSEGEARVIGIAGFLAELQIAPHMNPIVLDDPVSSLDHLYTEKVADRLIKEGMKRQVIIFTHNIAFLMELVDACTAIAKMGIPVNLSVNTLRKDRNYAGITAEGAPWHAKIVKERVAELEQLIHQAEPLYDVDPVAYNKEAAYIYGLLREAWESCIENDLLDGIVCRYRNSIETQRLDRLTIEDADVKLLDLHMSNASKWITGHDKSKALDPNRPSPTEIVENITALRDFLKSISTRKEQTRKRRKKSLLYQAEEPNGTVPDVLNIAR